MNATLFTTLDANHCMLHTNSVFDRTKTSWLLALRKSMHKFFSERDSKFNLLSFFIASVDTFVNVRIYNTDIESKPKTITIQRRDCLPA